MLCSTCVRSFVRQHVRAACVRAVPALIRPSTPCAVRMRKKFPSAMHASVGHSVRALGAAVNSSRRASHQCTVKHWVQLGCLARAVRQARSRRPSCGSPASRWAVAMCSRSVESSMHRIWSRSRGAWHLAKHRSRTPVVPTNKRSRVNGTDWESRRRDSNSGTWLASRRPAGNSITEITPSLRLVLNAPERAPVPRPKRQSCRHLCQA